MKRGDCAYCQAAILWVQTVNGKPMPLDAEPNAAGNAYVEYAVGGSGLVVRVASKSEPRPSGVAHMPHWSTCPRFDKRASAAPKAKPKPPPPEPASLFDQ